VSDVLHFLLNLFHHSDSYSLYHHLSIFCFCKASVKLEVSGSSALVVALLPDHVTKLELTMRLSFLSSGMAGFAGKGVTISHHCV